MNNVNVVTLTDDELTLVKTTVAVYMAQLDDILVYMQQKGARDRNGNPPTADAIQRANERRNATQALWDKLFGGT